MIIPVATDYYSSRLGRRCGPMGSIVNPISTGSSNGLLFSTDSQRVHCGGGCGGIVADSGSSFCPGGLKKL